MPARNRKDFDDIPEEVRQQLTFIWLERVDDAVSSRLEPAKAKEAADREAVCALLRRAALTRRRRGPAVPHFYRRAIMISASYDPF